MPRTKKRSKFSGIYDSLHDFKCATCNQTFQYKTQLLRHKCPIVSPHIQLPDRDFDSISDPESLDINNDMMDIDVNIDNLDNVSHPNINDNIQPNDDNHRRPTPRMNMSSLNDEYTIILRICRRTQIGFLSTANQTLSYIYGIAHAHLIVFHTLDLHYYYKHCP